ncbi:MAG: protein kinase [Candidatus Aminicenantes bacterium]|nr:protein kinase [Candidatus Aminicenantes bacterium]
MKTIDKKLTQLLDELKADALREAHAPRVKDKEARASEEIESKLSDILSDLERKGQDRSASARGGAEPGQEFLPEFGRYVLVEKLGYDGIAETFKAKRAEGREGRFCVLKRIRLQFRKENVMAVFLEEARQLARLSHPNIVSLLDFGKLNEYGFLVFDYVEGPSLGAVLNAFKARKQTMAFPLMAAVGVQVCRGLEAAYATPGPGGIPLGIIHGNITPSNILLSAQGEVLLTDFCLFRTSQRLYQAVPASFRNKIAYLSPQQARGEQVDARADIYAIGSVLFELATGQPVFPKVLDPAVFHKILLGQVIPVIPKSFEAPETLRRAILKALEYEPQHRHPKIEDLRKDLERYLNEAGEPLSQSDELSRLTAVGSGVAPGRAGAAQARPRRESKSEVLKVAFPALEILEAGRPASVPPPSSPPEERPSTKPAEDIALEDDLRLAIEPIEEVEEVEERPALEASPPASVPPPVEASAPSVVEEVTEPLSQYRLLVVTPNALTQKVVRMAFGHKDFELSFIAEGSEALAVIDDFRPDAVVIDLNTNAFDPYDLCDKIRSNPRQAQNCIVFIRKEFEKVDLDRLDTLDYDLMIYMPVPAKEFEEKVRTILHQKRMMPGG